MAFRRVRYRSEAMADVNMTNMIDIVMVLLIVFILVSNFVQTSLTIKIPKVRYAETTGKEKIIAEVNAAGDFLLNGNKVTEDELISNLQTLHEQNPDEGLFIRADEQAAWGDVAAVLSIGKELGFQDVNLPARMAPKTP
ncbi:MAG: biopolymer transporter ExbD [Candidatus Omnitrophica bacterium]|nr:biopolymer transporter ExbD [Candidatus Omnitrophota bacterium]